MESRRLITALLVCLGVCLVVIGIFIGRESARSDPKTSATAPVPATASASPAKPLPPIFEPPPQPIAAPTGAPSPSASAAAPAVDPAERQRVARYFRDVDRLQNVDDVDDPQASAQALVNAASSGDSSGLQKLVAQARTAEQQARALTPPPPCAAYHRKLLGVLAASREMVQKLANGFAGGSLEALPGLLTRANAEKERAESLARDEKELKRRYGL